MTKLSKTNLAFLNKHRISLGAVFDATGLGPKDYGKAMRALGKAIAYGVTPCRKGRHTLRSRSGTCVVCFPASLSFQSRFEALAYVYIAGSLKLNLIKAGYASEISARSSSLNEQNYAGASDWEILFWVKTENAGRIEFNLHTELSEYRSPTSFVRSGEEIDCLETFSCGAFSAIDTLKLLTKNEIQTWLNKKNVHRYDFNKTKNRGIKRKGNSRGNSRATPLVISEQNPFSDKSLSIKINELSSSEQMIESKNNIKKNVSIIDPISNNNSRKPFWDTNKTCAIIGSAVITFILILLS